MHVRRHMTLPHLIFEAVHAPDQIIVDSSSDLSKIATRMAQLATDHLSLTEAIRSQV